MRVFFFSLSSTEEQRSVCPLANIYTPVYVCVQVTECSSSWRHVVSTDVAQVEL